MLFKFSSSSYQYNGRVNGEIWTSSDERGIARRRSRPAPRSQKLRFVPLFTLEEGKDEWSNLDDETREEWDDFAAVTFGWPIQGSPRYMDGRTFFANYYTVLRLIDPAASVPGLPAQGPVWQIRPKFFEIAEWISETYTLKAETGFDANTVLLFSGLPPTAAGFKPDFALEQFIGHEEFYSGLTPDETYDGVHSMMENAFGSISSSLKIWGRVWEVQDGYIRTIKDPCGPDPGGAPPVTENSFEYEIYNDYHENVAGGSVVFNFDSSTEIGSITLDNLGMYDTMTGTVNLVSGYSLDDVNEWNAGGMWDDTMPFGYGSSSPPALDPFALTLSAF